MISVTLTTTEAELYDREDYEAWRIVRRIYQERAVAMLAGKSGSIEFYHPDGTLIDWLRVMESATDSSFEEFEN